MTGAARGVLAIGLGDDLARHARALGATLVTSAPAAIEHLNGGGPRPSCVVADDGSWSDALHAACAGVRVVLLASPPLVVGDPATLASVWDFVVKPAHAAELRQRIARALRAPAEQRTDEGADRLRSELTALAVHDLRAPLSSLKLNLELIEQEISPDDEGSHEAVVDAQVQVGRLLSLTNGMLDVAELEEGLLRTTLAEVSLTEFLPMLVLGHQRDLSARRLRVDVDVRPATLRAWFDPGLLGRVLENLLDNAVRYAAVGGLVRVEARREEAGLVLRVGNDGPAVPDAERSSIFEKFHRIEARRAGVRANRGLGLYFCKLAVEAHGGQIRVTTQPGLPTVFEVVMPGWRSAPERQPGAPAPSGAF